MKLETYIEDLTVANRQLVRDRDEATHRNALTRDRIAELESENRSLEASFKINREALEV